MRVRVTVPPPCPPWERTVAGQVWPEGVTEHDLLPEVVQALEENMRSARASRVVQAERLDAADLVAVRIVCPPRTSLSGQRMRLPDGSCAWLTQPGFWSGGRHWPTGTTEASVPPELAYELEAEVAAGRSILTIARLDGAGQVLSTVAPTEATLRALA